MTSQFSPRARSRRTLVVAAALGIALLGACGGGNDPATDESADGAVTETTMAETEGGAEVDEETLKSIVVTADDLGEGWTSEEVVVRRPAADDPLNGLCAEPTPERAHPQVVVVQRHSNPPTDAPAEEVESRTATLEVGVDLYETEAEAEARMESARADREQCATTTETGDDGTTTERSMEERDRDALGDDVFAFRTQTVVGDYYTGEAESVFTRVGRAVVFTSHTTGYGTPEKPEKRQTDLVDRLQEEMVSRAEAAGL